MTSDSPKVENPGSSDAGSGQQSDGRGQRERRRQRDRHRGLVDDPPMLSADSGLCGGPGQISCEEANEMIQMVIDQVVDAEEHAKLEEHLGDCSPCESEFVVYQRIVTSLSNARPYMPPETAARLQRYCDELRKGGIQPLDEGS